MSAQPPPEAVFHFAGTIQQFTAGDVTYLFDPPAVLAEGDYWLQVSDDEASLTLRKVGSGLVWTAQRETTP